MICRLWEIFKLGGLDRVLNPNFAISGAVGQREEISRALNALAEDAGDLMFSNGHLQLRKREGGWPTTPDGGDVGFGHLAICLNEPIGEDVELWTT